MRTSLLLVEKNFGEEPKHALILNETLIYEQVSDKLESLIVLAEKISAALQTQYSLMVCDTKNQFEALLKEISSELEP